MVLPRIYPILDTFVLTRREYDLVSAAEALLEGGAQIVQIRHKTAYSRTIFEQSRRVAELCRRAGTLFVIDDRADVAVLTGAGVHVGQDDLPPCDVRKIVGPDAVVGFSTHNTAQFAAALREPVDYLAIGPVFPTRSKENPDPVVGLEGLAALPARGGLPLVAIGGITRENARDVLRAGADSVAVIHDILPDNPGYRALRERMEEWRKLVTE